MDISFVYEVIDDKDTCRVEFTPEFNCFARGKQVFLFTHMVTDNIQDYSKAGVITFFPNKDIPFFEGKKEIWPFDYKCFNRFNKEESPRFDAPGILRIYNERDEMKERIILLSKMTSEDLERGEYERLKEEADKFDVDQFAKDLLSNCF